MTMNRAAYVVLAILAACTPAEEAPADSPAGGASSRDGEPAAAHLVDGPIEYTAETLIMESFPVQLAAIVTARNTTDSAVVLNFPYPCVAHLEAYTDSTRAGEPAWTQERFMGCIAAVFDDTIAAGDTAQYAAPRTDGFEVLGDSLPDGRYWLSITLTPEGQRLVVPAGVADLAVPR